MKCLDDHHHYVLDRFENPENSEELKFINKKPKEFAEGDGEPGLLVTVHAGTTNEEVLRVLIDRMNGLIGKFPDAYSQSARSHMISALADLEMRTNERKRRGVEGKHLA